MNNYASPARIRFSAANAPFAKLVIIVFYFVGVCGMLLPFLRPLFSDLFPLAILLSLGLILVFHPAAYDMKTLIVFAAVALTGFLAEVAGVSTGMVFGSYRYGDSLGTRLFETPLLIGINWLILTYAGSAFAGLLGIRSFAAVPAGAALMVLYDLLLEQAAPLLDMWHWQSEKVPFQNYLAWFVLSFIFQYMFRIFGVDTRNAVVPALITAQVIFFTALLIAFN